MSTLVFETYGVYQDHDESGWLVDFETYKRVRGTDDVSPFDIAAKGHPGLYIVHEHYVQLPFDRETPGPCLVTVVDTDHEYTVTICPKPEVDTEAQEALKNWAKRQQ